MTLIIDARGKDEYNMSHVNGAININAEMLSGSNLPAALQDISKETEVIVYCRSGMRSGSLIKMLQARGFTNVTNGIHQKQVEKMISAS
jgi:rhodanese-related sulfurtransferase